MHWSFQQQAALDAVGRWLGQKDIQVFRLFGFAGTGKTTLARYIAEQEKREVLFGAYTGKAALVLASKGCEGARTIHSMIYRPSNKQEMEEEPSFVLNEDSAAANADLIIIDECSMVDAELGRDLLSFGKKILVLGDPGQLPPIRGGGFFTDTEPDIMLSEVHRQAKDNPIIHLSMLVREGKELKQGDFGAVRIMDRGSIDAAMVTKADQILVGMNKTRHAYNRRLRHLRGFEEELPLPGDKLVCLRNDRKKGLMNGGLWQVKKRLKSKGNLLRLHVIPEEDINAKGQRVGILPQFFSCEGQEIPFAQRRNSDEFDYGYALTVHKAQGSQWNDVVLFDESFAFREYRHRWLYTGLTRAAERLTIVRG